MSRALLAAAAAAVLALGVAGTASSHGHAAVLKGTVGPGFTISLTQQGKKVTSLKAGTYTIVISDKASIHSFVLEREHGGAKVEYDVTSVPFTGTKTMRVKLAKGEWKYYCKPHESTMNGTFEVT